MNKTKTGVSRKKQLVVISALVGLLTIISFLLFYYGRQHRIIIDNRSVELPDGRNFRSLAGALVAVNHQSLSKEEIKASVVPPSQRPLLSFKFWPSTDPSISKAVEMMPRERIMVKVLGPEFNLKFEAYDRMGEPLGQKNIDIHMGTKKDAMVRLVKLHNDLPDFLEEYPNQARERQAAQENKAAEENQPTGMDSPAPPSFGD